MSIEDLMLFDSVKAEAGEYDPDSFKEGLGSLKKALADEVPHEAIRKILIELKASLNNYPQIVHELLETDVGVLVGGIKRISDVVLVKDTTKQNKKKAGGNISRAKLAELINAPPEDF
jgi:hypothetical protein